MPRSTSEHTSGAVPDFRTAAPGTAGADLLGRVEAMCNRLAGAGWAELLRRHGLDLAAGDLAAELSRTLPAVDRTQPGFGDFAPEGVRGIEPGRPALSLLFHALASPEVRSYRDGDRTVEITEFPTPAEIETVENYVFGSSPPSVPDLRARAGDAPLAIVVFAAEYRPGDDTVHRKHADMCFSRTGVARIGTVAARYRPSERGYLPTVDGDGKAVAVQPCRYAAYIAALTPGRKRQHGPMHFVESDGGDADRRFWLPMHKLFDGPECLRGHDLVVRLAAHHVNEKIRRAHLFFSGAGHDGGWQEPDLSEPPFVLREGIAEFSTDPADGSWLLTPVHRSRLVEPATYHGEPLTFVVPASTPTAQRWSNYQSSLNLLPGPNGGRAAPEYLHARHVVTAGGEENLNAVPNVRDRVRAGGYRARHYVDHTADGWIEVECGALALEVPRRIPAYSIVASPDYFPAVRQSDLVRWTDQSAPPGLLSTIWPRNPGRPEPLSAQRVAANLELAAGFDATDETMTAVVGAHGSGLGGQARLDPPTGARASMLSDGAAGVFAPGWDVSFDRTPETTTADGVQPGVTFLNNYGLGSPFAEDSMLCAALSSFWPAVAPDVTRTFAPGPRYATATPLIDEVIGLAGGGPWDGIEGPRHDPAGRTVDYRALAYGDYVEAALANRFDSSVIARTTVDDYIARTLTMAMVYNALGAVAHEDKVRWAVLSFQLTRPDDQDLADACTAWNRRLDPRYTYRFEMIRHDGAQTGHRDPCKFDRVLVTYSECVLLFADPTVVFRRRADGSWAASP